MEKKQITLQIDRHYITVPEGATILEAARKIGIDIPTLCHIDLKGTCIKNNPASCRICVVEVEGRAASLDPRLAATRSYGGDGGAVPRTLRVMNARNGGCRTHPVRPSQRLPHLPQMRQLRATNAGTALQHPHHALQRRRAITASGR